MTVADLQLSPPANLRDLGGIPIASGAMRSGLALRSDDLSLITVADAEALVDAGVTNVIDLRNAREIAISGRGVLAAYPVAYHHLSLQGEVATSMPGGTVGLYGPLAMGHMYAAMVEQAASQLATALSVIALAPGTTAFHCAGGRDRTGVLAAMLLTALGAREDAIVADYSKTAENIDAVQQRVARVIGPVLAAQGLDLDSVTRQVNSGPMEISMRTMFALLRERHGDPLSPVRAGGLSPDTIVRLRERAIP